MGLFPFIPPTYYYFSARSAAALDVGVSEPVGVGSAFGVVLVLAAVVVFLILVHSCFS